MRPLLGRFHTHLCGSCGAEALCTDDTCMDRLGRGRVPNVICLCKKCDEEERAEQLREAGEHA
jgi:RNase P subunit RPR2